MPRPARPWLTEPPGWRSCSRSSPHHSQLVRWTPPAESPDRSGSDSCRPLRTTQEALFLMHTRLFSPGITFRARIHRGTSDWFNSTIARRLRSAPRPRRYRRCLRRPRGASVLLAIVSARSAAAFASLAACSVRVAAACAAAADCCAELAAASALCAEEAAC